MSSAVGYAPEYEQTSIGEEEVIEKDMGEEGKERSCLPSLTVSDGKGSKSHH